MFPALPHLQYVGSDQGTGNSRSHYNTWPDIPETVGISIYLFIYFMLRRMCAWHAFIQDTSNVHE